MRICFLLPKNKLKNGPQIPTCPSSLPSYGILPQRICSCLGLSLICGASWAMPVLYPGEKRYLPTHPPYHPSNSQAWSSLLIRPWSPRPPRGSFKALPILFPRIQASTQVATQKPAMMTRHLHRTSLFSSMGENQNATISTATVKLYSPMVSIKEASSIFVFFFLTQVISSLKKKNPVKFLTLYRNC